jgi:predicted GIY-YIG superfamily endonuclease
VIVSKGRSFTESLHRSLVADIGTCKPLSMGFWVYMLRCADGSYYVGHTDDIEKRIPEHESGAGCGYTSTRQPVRVVFTEEFAAREEALAAEVQIKGWSRRKKEALIQRDWTAITRLARRRTPFRKP